MKIDRRSTDINALMSLGKSFVLWKANGSSLMSRKSHIREFYRGGL